MSVAGNFRLSQAQAKAIVREVAAGVSQWRDVAGSYHLGKREVDRMASAFEHTDIEKAKQV
jgi:serine/threonine-protein kinase HipA